MTAIGEARAALDRAVEEIRSIKIPDPKNGRLVERAGRAAFGAVCRLVSLIRRNSLLARVAEESAADYHRSLARLHAEERRTLLRLRRIRNAIITRDRSLDPSTQAAIQPHGSKLLSGFDEFLEKALKNLGRDDSFFSSGKHRAAERLWQVFDHVDGNEPRLKNWKDGCHGSATNLERLRRARHVLDESNPGSRWIWLARVPIAANPPEGLELWLSEGDRTESPTLGPLYKVIHHQTFLDEPECRRACQWLSDLQTCVHAIATDFHVQLGQRASIAWILHRYASRCRCLRRDELIEMLNRLPAGKKPELALTQDAAVFLFDQGFDVLTEQSMGKHRYDLIAGPLLVEAKICDGKRHGLDAVADGLSQIHQYTNARADEGVPVEPVLLLFRLSGPRATPVSEYKIGNLRVTIAHVDLGSSDESGCNSAPPEPDITEEAISAALRRRQARSSSKATRPRGGRTPVRR